MKTAEEILRSYFNLKFFDLDLVELNLEAMEDYANQFRTKWIPVTERLPDALETVWLSNGKGWTTLGCRVIEHTGWFWAESNGVIYEENGC